MQQETSWTKELERIALIIRKTKLEKTIKWGAEVYTFNGNNVISYGGFKNYFAVWFYNGVFLKDKHNVLINAQEGKTKSLRQWRMTSMDQIDEKKILEYIEEAIEVEKQGLKVKPEKFISVPLSKFLEDTFKNDEPLRIAFEKLTPGKQKEYSIYIDEARQEATKTSRFDKIRPMIMHGVGLNNKYK